MYNCALLCSMQSARSRLTAHELALILSFTETQIRQVVVAGARSWREVREKTGCGTQCGKCACTAKTVAQHAIKDTLIASADDLAYAI